MHPAAAAADAIVSAVDQNVQVHLPNATVATELEAVTLDMLSDLLRISFINGGEASRFAGRTFTTGATSSNVLGLACGREAVIRKRLPPDSPAVGELGLLEACSRAGIKRIQVLTSAGHSSLSKAASIVGIGRACVKEVTKGNGLTPWLLDLEAVEEELKAGSENGTANIIAISMGEVNSGYYAVQNLDDYKKLAALAWEHKAWIHVDGGELEYTQAVFPLRELTPMAYDSLWHICSGSSSTARIRKGSKQGTRLCQLRGQHHSGRTQALERGTLVSTASTHPRASRQQQLQLTRQPAAL